MALTNYVLMPGADYQGICDAVRAKTGKTNALKSGELATEIAAIETGGGSMEGVHIVTFMSEDGSTVLYERPVADGDNCANVVDRGLLAAPTKASTAQYNYTYSGWSLTKGGSASASALSAVTEDRVVYAAFTSAVRYYTITYYDSDGVTVLKTESVAYGSTPAYIPQKEGSSFNGWIPEITTVTGDTSYQAQWLEKITFAGGSWTDIAEISERGEAAQYFAVGDTKDVILTRSDGTTETIQVAIAGFNHDTLEDGSTNAGISIVCLTVPNYTTAWSAWSMISQFGNACGQYYGRSSNAQSGYASNSYVRTTLNNTVFSWLPAELKNAIKPVLKSYDVSHSSGAAPVVQTTAEKLWALSTTELGDDNSAFGTDIISDHGSMYELFTLGNLSTSNSVLAPVKVSTGARCASYWTRSIRRGGSSPSPIYIEQGSGSLYDKYSAGYTQEKIQTARYLRFGFCI
jgi:hypothetical protein